MSNMDILKDLTDAVKATGGQATKPYDTPATVIRVEGDIVWVHIPGGVDETPVRHTIAAKPGDVVQIRVSGGSACIVGNETAPPTDDTKAEQAIKKAEKASGVATDFVTDMKNGIFVHPKDDGKTGVRIQNSVSIVQNGESVAEYGDASRIGKVTAGHIVIDRHGIKHYNTESCDVEVGADPSHDIPVLVVGDSNSYTIHNAESEADAPDGPVMIIGSNNNVVNAAVTPAIIGYDNSVEWNGTAIGHGNNVYGGTAIGNNLTTDEYDHSMPVPGDSASLTIGCWNDTSGHPGDNAFTIGGGSGDNDRADIFNVLWDGSVRTTGQMRSGARPMFAVDSVTEDNISIAAGGNSGSLTISVAKAGYSAVAVKGIRINNASASGAGAANCAAYAWAVGSSSMSIAIHNHGSSAAKIKIIVDVFYVATSAM